ncbi:hypothetical protein G647_06467 [Cladophialophora carrionii CBS 160.54]|uniref:DUF1279 domain-containing protein n=1 Tax=Cladophialophora carrionii CBS 160.54 TaxID=1279043 RepID=V9D7X5_9EURO|nr:uncharacterized protein G647_06467 [Cladophialophora carrionii CBS 160.54]ETI22393.1 hypothetical protein G647_06467 [Cladophialophora carrionii CBS 160.54]
MKSMRLVQRNASMRHLLAARPAAHQSRAPLQQSFRTRPTLQQTVQTTSLSRMIHTQRVTTTSPSQILRSARLQQPPRRPAGRRYKSSTSTPDAEPTSLKDRLKKMSREYGWTAVGVYLALSALDFPFCFLAVRLIGTDTIGHYEHVVMEGVKNLVKWPIREAAGDVVGEAEVADDKRVLDEKSEEEVLNDHGYREAERANRGDNASLWTQLALAYAVHKSFIFIRVPLTAAILPKVVKTLRSWGYNIGKMPTRKAVTPSTGVNTKGSKVKPGD